MFVERVCCLVKVEVVEVNCAHKLRWWTLKISVVHKSMLGPQMTLAVASVTENLATNRARSGLEVRRWIPPTILSTIFFPDPDADA